MRWLLERIGRAFTRGRSALVVDRKQEIMERIARLDPPLTPRERALLELLAGDTLPIDQEAR